MGSVQYRWWARQSVVTPPAVERLVLRKSSVSPSSPRRSEAKHSSKLLLPSSSITITNWRVGVGFGRASVARIVPKSAQGFVTLFIGIHPRHPRGGLGETGAPGGRGGGGCCGCAPRVLITYLELLCMRAAQTTNAPTSIPSVPADFVHPSTVDTTHHAAPPSTEHTAAGGLRTAGLLAK